MVSCGVIMIISSSRSFVFIHLEKCGGTSVESALQPHLAWYDMILGSTEYGEKMQNLYYERFGRENVNKEMLWKHSTAKDVHAFLGETWDEFLKISVVRDPVEIMKSFYFFSRTTMKYHVGRINREKWKELIRTDIFPEAYPYTERYFVAFAQSELNDSGIDGFIDFALNNDRPCINPQVERLEINKNIPLGMVVDLSQLNERWSDILYAVGIEEPVKLEQLNTSEREDVSISNRSRKMIHRHFAIDYDVLPRYTGVSW